MKRIALICCVVVMAGCNDDQGDTALESQWTVTWQMDNQQVNGELILFKDNYARLSVFGSPGSLFMRDTSSVDYRWALKNHELTLKRFDNNVQLKYEVLQKSPDYLELSFAKEVVVKLHRKDMLANI